MTHYDAFTVKLNELIEKNDAQLLRCDYFQKIFGNIILEINYRNKTYIILSDRGEIYLNNLLICGSNYHIKGRYDNYQKILDIINDKIFKH